MPANILTEREQDLGLGEEIERFANGNTPAAIRCEPRFEGGFQRGVACDLESEAALDPLAENRVLGQGLAQFGQEFAGVAFGLHAEIRERGEGG